MADMERGVQRKDTRELSTQVPGEKVVHKTEKAMDVEPEQDPAVPNRPSDPAAVDRRKQFSGTDEPAPERGGPRKTADE